jgi:cardiolipin synthase
MTAPVPPLAEPGRDPESAVPPAGEVDAIWTLPNLITLIRLLCLPVFLYLLFGLEERAAAAWLLGALGATDWVDGYLARRLGQVSEFGKKFDPTVDRLLFIVGLGAIVIDGSAPIVISVLILAREIVLGAAVAIATLVYGMERFDVTFLGKTATFLLMFAVPGFLMGASEMPGAEWFQVASWILAVPGVVLSYVTAFAYVPKIRDGIRAHRTARV